MKSGWPIFIAVLLLSIIGYFSSHWLSGYRASEKCAECNMALSNPADALAWMQHDYALSAHEFAKVCALHEAYVPQCNVMCQQIAKSTALLTETLRASPTMTEEAQTVLRDYEAARADCLRKTLQHVLDTAAAMKPEAGRAFLQKVLPDILTSRQHVQDFQHSSAPT